jgi:hypothetical protein
MNAVLIQIDAFDPIASSAVTLRAASHDDERVCMLDGQIWWPVLQQLPSLSYDMFSGQFDGAVTSPDSSLSFATEPWPDLPRWSFPDGRLQLWTGELGTAWGAFTKRFDGRVRSQPPIAEGLATLGFGVDDNWLDAPLLPTYAGSGGAEGPAALKGVDKPLSIGAPRYVGGVQVDAVLNIWQFSCAGLIEGYDAVLDRLVRYPAAVADHATHAALAAAVIAPGFYATCLAEGKIRFGAPPFGKVSALIRGDKGGPDGWARTPGKIVRRIALLSGGAGKIDDASLNALDISRPYNCSIHFAQQTTARPEIQQLAASVNAVAGVSWLGKLFVAPVGIGASILTLRADGSELVGSGGTMVAASEIAGGLGAPFHRLVLAAERTWDVHGEGDYAAIDALPGTLEFDQVTGATKPADNADVTIDQAVVSRLSDTSGRALESFIDSEGHSFSRIVGSGEARDGDAVNFAAALVSIPRIVFLPGGNSGTAGQNLSIQTIGLSVSGFTMKAKSQTVTAGSTITDGSASGGSGGEPQMVINRTNSGHPYDNRFTFNYSVTVNDLAPGEPGYIRIGIFAKIASSWVQVGESTHSFTGSYDLSAGLASVDFGAGNEFGISTLASEGSGTAISGFASVAYTLGSLTETSLTPSGASPIPWLALLQ